MLFGGYVLSIKDEPNRYIVHTFTLSMISNVDQEFRILKKGITAGYNLVSQQGTFWCHNKVHFWCHGKIHLRITAKYTLVSRKVHLSIIRGTL